MSEYDVGEGSKIAWAAPEQWEASPEVYKEYVSISSSLAVANIRVAISPLFQALVLSWVRLGFGAKLAC